MKVTPPGDNVIERDQGTGQFLPTVQFRQWLSIVSDVLTAPSRRTSGATASRPTRDLYAGRMFFDTDLGQPIWYDADAADWVDADGNSI